MAAANGVLIMPSDRFTLDRGRRDVDVIVGAVLVEEVRLKAEPGSLQGREGSEYVWISSNLFPLVMGEGLEPQGGFGSLGRGLLAAVAAHGRPRSAPPPLE